jgi:gamma-glutamyltranspeptidase/glutathione hydrolase
MGRSRWILAGAAVLALAAPVQAQEKQPTAIGSGGAAASVDPLATQAAITVMAGGGNAFDAAIAAASVLGVVEPYSCGIGGGGFMVLRDGDSGRITTIDSREKAPAAMKPDSFFINGKPPTDAQFPLNRYSGMSVGVPGTPAAWDYVIRHFGTISLSKALSYGANVATNGFYVDKTFFDQTTAAQNYFDDIPSTAKIYLDGDGTSKDVGRILKNPDMARTYRRIGRLGATKGFYSGPLANAIVSAVQHVPAKQGNEHEWKPGLMTLDDLSNYRIKQRDPVKLSYFGADIYGMGPPSSGGTTTLEALNIIQDFQRRGVAFNGRVDLLYHYLEASRLAYADRNAYLGDPSFVTNPVAGLLSDSFAAQRAALIGAKAPSGAAAVVAAGTPPAATATGSSASVDRVGSTTHLSVADKDGNIVSYTFTIEQTGGNGVVVPGYGFLLNNELTDFDTGSVTAPNRAAGNKRPRSSIAPTIVMKGDKPWFTIGSPGGASIITTVLQTLVNRINSHMPLEVAIGQPRASQRNSSTTEAESGFVSSNEGQLLQNYWGERYRAPAGDEIGALTGIEFQGKRFKAIAEPNRRGGGSAKVVTPAAGPNP